MEEKDDFSEAFPALSSEIREGVSKGHSIGGVRQTMSDRPEPQQAAKTFYPNVVDYIRRCETVSQAVEIVDYLLKRGEISSSQAKTIKSQLKSEGLRSFGSKKESGHYLKHGLE